MRSELRIAFVIDALPSLGGGEKVLLTALEVFPRAEVFTLLYNKECFVNTPIARMDVHTSFLDFLPGAHHQHRLFLPLMPRAIERFDLSGFDVIVCFSYAVAHGVKRCGNARHLAYMFTPMRYAWTDLNIDGTHTRKHAILHAVMSAFRRWDRAAAARVAEFATVSQSIADRIASTYGRTASVIYPPVEVDRFSPGAQRENFYITVSRLVPHKRIDLVVRAFSQMKLPLVVVGDGPERPRLQRIAAPNIRFLGYVSDDVVAQGLATAQGFVCMAEEDFGIAIVEAQAAGCPVIAYGRGGALETVVEGVTGIFFQEQTVPALVSAVMDFEARRKEFRAQAIVESAQSYDKSSFVARFRDFVNGSKM